MNENATLSWSQVSDWIADPVVAGALGGLVLFSVLGFCSIFARAGFHWALGTLMLVPGLNVILFALLSFGAWPKNRELRSLRKLESDLNSADARRKRAA